MATNMTFQDFVTPVPSDWLNNVNTVINNIQPTIINFGGVPDGITDNTQALQKAIAACPPGKVTVVFPAGNFHFANSFTYAFPAGIAGFSLVGAGSDLTVLSFGNMNGPSLTLGLNGPFSSFNLQGFTLLATQPGGPSSLYRGIFISQDVTSIPNPANTAPSNISGVSIRGSDGYQALNYFNDAVFINGVSNINFTQLQISGNSGRSGNGITMFGTNIEIPVVFNFFGCTFNGCASGINYAASTQGVSVVACNFTGCNFGISAAAGNSGLDQLCVSGCQFNAFNAGIGFESPLSACSITNNLFLIQNNSFGISMNGTQDIVISGNTFDPTVSPNTNTTGVQMGVYNLAASIITGNSFYNLTNGIILQAASQFVNVQSNVYHFITNPVINSGTNNTVGGGSM